VTEKITLTLEAKDNSGGAQTVKFNEAVAGCSYFQSALGKNNEVRLTAISTAAGTDGKSFKQFTLECRYPDKTR